MTTAMTLPSISSMSLGDLRSATFQDMVDNVFNIGRKEIAQAANIVTALNDDSFMADSDSAAFKTMQDMREIFEGLNPSHLSGQTGIMRFFPIPGIAKRRVVNYLEKFKSSVEMIDHLVAQLSAAQDHLRRDTQLLSESHQQLVASVTTLNEIESYLMNLEAQIVSEMAGLDEERKNYVEAELLFYLRRNLQATKAQKLTNSQGIVNVESQRRAARSLINGCDEMKTMGTATLALAVNLARTQGFQITVMSALSGGQAAINSLISTVADMNSKHADQIIEYESKPLQDIDILITAVNTTLATIKRTETARIANGKKIQENTKRLSALADSPQLAYYQRSDINDTLLPEIGPGQRLAAHQLPHGLE